MPKKLTELQKASRAAKREKNKANKAVGKLKRTIMWIDVSDFTYDKWVQYRKHYIGGSDVASILEDENGQTLNPYQSKLECFHEKVGVISKTGEESEATYSGHVLEEHIKKHYWCWHDMDEPTFEKMIYNRESGKQPRFARNVKNLIGYDPRMPWLKINIDGFIQNTRWEKAPRGLLEVKSGLGRVWNEYIEGIPVFYVLQVQTYMLVTGIKYAEVAVLLDGRYFKCFPMVANDAIQQKILSDTKEFWSLVEEGRLIWEDPNLTKIEKMQALSVIEPPPNGSAALDKYLKERFRSDYKAGKLLIDDSIIEAGKSYKAALESEKDAKTFKNKFGSTLRKTFLDNEVDEIVNDQGRVIISYRKEGEKFVLRVNKSILEM